MSQHTLTAAVAEVFRSRPNQWIRAEVFEKPGGRQGWRTRISNCRTAFGMDIQNRVRVEREHSTDCPALQAWDIEDACHCGLPKRYKVSEYCYRPAVVPVQAVLFEQGAR